MQVVGPSVPQLEATIASVRGQAFEDWELCLYEEGSSQPHVAEVLRRAAEEDSRVRIGGSGGGDGAPDGPLAMTRGSFIALLGDRDQLSRDALVLIDEAIRSRPGVDFVYSDEDAIDEQGNRFDALFKPDWSPERLRVQMYVGGLSVMRRSLVETVGGMETRFDEAGDWDLALRVTERARSVLHVPRVLYHRRKTVKAASEQNGGRGWPAGAACRAVQAHCRRIGLPAIVEADVDGPGVCRLRPVLETHPTVSIVIPTMGQSREVRGEQSVLVAHCVRSILSTSTYDLYEIVCVADASTPPAILDELREIAGERLQLVRYEEPFNFSAKVNLGAERAAGDHLLLLNDDMEVVTPDWIERMLMYSSHAGVGGVGAQLRWEDDRIQHAGVVFENGLPGHVYRGAGDEFAGYAENALVTQNYSAVTAACLMTPREAFEEVGGFATELPVNYNDVDYCLKLGATGRRVVYDADTVLYHFESSSRSSKVHSWEKALFFDRWRSTIGIDPFSNPSLRYGHPRSRLDRSKLGRWLRQLR